MKPVQPKIKLLYDMEQLSASQGKGTGIVRVANILLKELLQNKKIEVYPLVTTTRGNVFEYLRRAGLENLRPKIVFLPHLRKTCKKDNYWKKIVSKVMMVVYGFTYKRKLSEFNAYLSLFSPISPLVYESGLKTFAFVHDLIPVKKQEYCDTMFAKKYARWMRDLHADIIFSISESTKADLRSVCPSISSEQIKVVYLGADQMFAPAESKEQIKTVQKKYGIESEKYILAVSEISPRKNFVHLLEAYAILADKMPDQDISLVLTGPVRKGFLEVADKISHLEKYRNRIVQTGFVADEDMPALYSGAMVFVYPSLYEGFGLPVLEAMQCGAPVVCAHNSSLPEVGGDAVCYISGRDVEHTAAVLHMICTNSAFQKELKEKAVLQAQKFSWHKFVTEVSNIIIKESNNG